MPRVTDAHLDSRRQEILRAALRCFARSGLQATTMRDIFAEAGLSAGAVYNYFRSKDDIVLAVIEADIEDTRALLSAFEAVEPQQAFAAILAAFFDELEAVGEDGRARIGTMIVAEAAARPELRARVAAGRGTVRRLLGAQLARLRPDAAPERLAALTDFLICLYQGLAVARALGERPDTRTMRAIVELVLHHLPEESRDGPVP